MSSKLWTIPGAYLTATQNSDETTTTYTAKVNPKGTVGTYSARTAPFMIPVNTPGYAAESPATSYSYEAGPIYV